MPVEACPKCGLVDRVRPKLITHNFRDAEVTPESMNSHCINDEAKFLSSPYVVGRNTLSALFCDRCGAGFIPESLVSELGLEPTGWR
jgi:hypothetical protein